ncbi:reverse transcriptase domain-containing protein [Vibrio lentus]|uniref:reverse transcriptase domain-containing protein n=1 Tax=Vibrio lentus TaxID=136468 RepID=UPI000C861A14|nr:reverse transcriptase domain-containing protein [Vibrio lentus]PMI56436.1 Reverse transcriptase (RNA-dependent DNA polymerase) [Vibrio lentus]
MKLLDKKYYNLEPKFEYLIDEFILGLAWKKSDGFIRTHNWYADLLSLDKCTLNIAEEVKLWAREIYDWEVLNQETELIPAPKGAKWSVDNGKWIQKTEERRVRPLADINIKEQSIATAIIMCLADAVETKQKDCDLAKSDYAEHLTNNVYSYGNRLVCDWEDDRARFRWGGSEYYRKFSIDYRNFLQRPISVGREVVHKVSEIDDVFVVSVDLTNFYGSIKLDLLIEKLKNIALSHYGNQYIEDANFWHLATEALHWEWSGRALQLASELNLPEEVGLPQGLASAGVLANAYLIDFDDTMGRKLLSIIENSGMVLQDYCRYVDDIRLVVSGESLTKDEIKNKVHIFVQQALDTTLSQDDLAEVKKLEVNKEKTQVLHLSDLDNNSSLTNRINEIQNEVGASSVSERSGLDNNIPALQQLLITEVDDFIGNAEELFPGVGTDKSIKVESIRRFSAHRLQTSLDKKRKLISRQEMEQFNNESTLIAKHLFKVWLKDPSIMVIFRKALDVDPTLDLYGKVFNVIFDRTKNNRDKTDKYIMLYLLSDIFRSTVDLYRNVDSSRLVEFKKLFSEVIFIAQKVLSSRANYPSYVYQQALFYLAIINKPYISTDKVSYDLSKLHSVLIKQPLDEFLSGDGYLFELSAQINDDYQGYASFLLNQPKRTVVDAVLRKFAFRGGDFWNAIWKEITLRKDERRINKFRWAIPKQECRPNCAEHYLSSIISFENNPFKYEHALLKLGIELAEALADKDRSIWCPGQKQYSPHEIKIKISENQSWDELWHSSATISCSVDKTEQIAKDPRYVLPIWLVRYQNSENDELKIYWLCCVLRSAALGNIDYTQRNDMITCGYKYSGIRSQWYKRRMGMLHTPESIVGTYGTISDWFASLLQHGLQWPGFSSSYIEEEDILAIGCLDDFKDCLQKRLTYLNAQICTSSNVPTLPTVVKRPELASNQFRIVTVQQLFPKDKHFHPSDVKLDHHDIRWKHREHLAEVCKLTEQTLSAKQRTESREQKSTADLIVFSEVAVHPDDEDILRALAFRTKAIIFAGFVFTELDGRIVNKARWIIPDSSESGIQWRIRDQGKFHMTRDEITLGVQGYRPSQHVISIEGHSEGPFKLTGAICYDATDIKLAADLRDLTDMFVIAAYNKDVNTFDNMASALQWHMYQHIVIANTGEYGGSTMQAPYKESYHKLISHTHGANQIAISTADIDLAAFRRKVKEYKKTKAQPAGFARKH